jgi:hypothetical protein
VYEDDDDEYYEPRRRWPRGTRVIALVMLLCLIGIPVLSLILR